MKPLNSCLKLLAVAAVVLLAACTGMEQKPPAGVSFDGLEPVPDTGFANVYKKPGASFSDYTAFFVEPCEVSFRKNWQRDQNQNRIDLSSQVTKKDVERIKAGLGEMCETTFRGALAEAPAYKVVDTTDGAEQVLVLAPSIINLDINAPDVMSAGRTRSYTTQSGEMTLLLELKDGVTGEVLVRVADRRKDFDDMQLQWTNSVTNRADAQRVLNRWAHVLRENLDRVRAAN